MSCLLSSINCCKCSPLLLPLCLLPLARALKVTPWAQILDLPHSSNNYPQPLRAYNKTDFRPRLRLFNLTNANQISPGMGLASRQMEPWERLQDWVMRGGIMHTHTHRHTHRLVTDDWAHEYKQLFQVIIQHIIRPTPEKKCQYGKHLWREN